MKTGGRNYFVFDFEPISLKTFSLGTKMVYNTICH